MIFSPLLPIPKRLSKPDLEHYRVKIETLLNDLTLKAEHWATSGETIAGESAVCMGPKCSLAYHACNRQVEIR